MSSNGFAKPLWIELSPGRGYRFFLLGLFLAALVSLLVTDLSLWFKGGLLIALAVLAFDFTTRPQPFERLNIEISGRLRLVGCDGTMMFCRTHGRVIRLGRLVFCRVRAESGELHPLVFDIHASDERWRRFLVAAHANSR